MTRPRVMPCLLLRGAGLVKTTRFAAPVYLGDPINVVKIFNDKEVDELILLDVQATPQRRGPDLEQVRGIASECFMPLVFGGGLRDVETMKRTLRAGVEKVALGAAAVEDPALVERAARALGSQSVVGVINVKRLLLRGPRVVTQGARRRTSLEPVAWARELEARGAGEILLNSVDRDGTRQGYDLELVRAVSAAVDVPVVACGGAGALPDLAAALAAGASAAAAGSMFVFAGKHNAVLISFPTPAEISAVLNSRVSRGP